MNIKLGFIKPNYPNEKRVALLPEDIMNFGNTIYIETGFGSELGIEDKEYIDKGCVIVSRREIFSLCKCVFSLKLIQESDYDLIKEEQIIIGWTHPSGSGKKFMEEQAIPKNLTIVDLDNIFPKIYTNQGVYGITSLEKNFIWKNSFMAGFSATSHALISHGLLPNISTKVAILASGSVSQGAYNAISKFGVDIRMFYRKTMDEFKKTISEYDVIINGIEVDDPNPNNHIINKRELKLIKRGALIIDAAADAGNAIEGTHYTSIENPIYIENSLYFYVVNNAPSIYYRESSKFISKSFSKNIYGSNLLNILNTIHNE